MIGRTLSHYQILEELGSGGMGIVYRARDTKLDRDVAIEFLPQDVASDEERIARFERETHLLASLNPRVILERRYASSDPAFSPVSNWDVAPIGRLVPGKQ